MSQLGLDFDAPAGSGSRADCVFCRIVADQDPFTLVCEWPRAMAIVPLNPVVDGHVIVLPKVHVPHAMYDVNVTAMTMMCASLLARHPCNLITSAGSEATQTIEHLHIHIVPRRAGDGLELPWTSK